MMENLAYTQLFKKNIYAFSIIKSSLPCSEERDLIKILTFMPIS
jgi:hypothetical protein